MDMNETPEESPVPGPPLDIADETQLADAFQLSMFKTAESLEATVQQFDRAFQMADQIRDVFFRIKTIEDQCKRRLGEMQYRVDVAEAVANKRVEEAADRATSIEVENNLLKERNDEMQKLTEQDKTAISKLREQLDTAIAQRDNAIRGNSTLEETVRRLESGVAERDRQIANLTNEASLKSVKNELASFKQKNSKLRATLQERNGEIAELKKKLSISEKVIAELKKELSNSERAIADLGKSVAGVKAACKKELEAKEMRIMSSLVPYGLARDQLLDLLGLERTKGEGELQSRRDFQDFANIVRNVEILKQTISILKEKAEEGIQFTGRVGEYSELLCGLAGIQSSDYVLEDTSEIYNGILRDLGRAYEQLESQ